MFERFAREARAVVELAVGEAATLRDDQVRPEHVLIALAAGGGPGAAALAALGHDADELRRSVQAWDAAALAAVGVATDDADRRGALAEAAGPAPRRLPFSPGAKRLLEAALHVALERRDRRIDTGHLLLGLVRDPARPTAALLDRLGLRGEDVARAVGASWGDGAARSA
jgi:ATP-dependent Clp protease ATP-binding subunit ClpA